SPPDFNHSSLSLHAARTPSRAESGACLVVALSAVHFSLPIWHGSAAFAHSLRMFTPSSLIPAFHSAAGLFDAWRREQNAENKGTSAGVAAGGGNCRPPARRARGDTRSK